MERTGFNAGQNVAIEFRWAEGQYNRLRDLTIELMSFYPNVIFCSEVPSVLAAKRAAVNIPIVFVSAIDPVTSGVVASLRPKENITGVSYAAGALGSKRLELLLELVPKASAIAVLRNPESSSGEAEVGDLQSSASRLKVRLNQLRASSADDISRAFATFDQQRPDALLVLTDLLFANQRHQLIKLAVHYRMPTIYDVEFFTRAGGLMSYGASSLNAYREGGAYVGQILRGALPSDLPILLPDRFRLLVNVEAAKSIGLNIPAALLLHADEIVE